MSPLYLEINVLEPTEQAFDGTKRYLEVGLSSGQGAQPRSIEHQKTQSLNQSIILLRLAERDPSVSHSKRCDFFPAELQTRRRGATDPFNNRRSHSATSAGAFPNLIIAVFLSKKLKVYGDRRAGRPSKRENSIRAKSQRNRERELLVGRQLAATVPVPVVPVRLVFRTRFPCPVPRRSLCRDAPLILTLIVSPRRGRPARYRGNFVAGLAKARKCSSR